MHLPESILGLAGGLEIWWHLSKIVFYRRDESQLTGNNYFFIGTSAQATNDYFTHYLDAFGQYSISFLNPKVPILMVKNKTLFASSRIFKL